MFGRRNLQVYTDAVSFSKKITLRMKCINRALTEEPIPKGELSSSLRKRVCNALDDHILNCENAKP